MTDIDPNKINVHGGADFSVTPLAPVGLES